MEFRHATVFYNCNGVALDNSFDDLGLALDFKRFIEDIEGFTNVDIMITMREE